MMIDTIQAYFKRRNRDIHILNRASITNDTSLHFLIDLINSNIALLLYCMIPIHIRIVPELIISTLSIHSIPGSMF